MANQQRPQEREVTNGYAHESSSMQQTANKIARARPEVQGYIAIAAGLLMVLFAFGFFPVLKWVIAAVGAFLFIWGAVRSHLFEATANYINKLRAKF